MWGYHVVLFVFFSLLCSCATPNPDPLAIKRDNLQQENAPKVKDFLGGPKEILFSFENDELIIHRCQKNLQPNDIAKFKQYLADKKEAAQGGCIIVDDTDSKSCSYDMPRELFITRSIQDPAHIVVGTALLPLRVILQPTDIERNVGNVYVSTSYDSARAKGFAEMILKKMYLEYQDINNTQSIPRLKAFVETYTIVEKTAEPMKKLQQWQEKLFVDNFDVDIIDKMESEERQKMERGLAQSAVITCKDIGRRIRIAPKRDDIGDPLAVTMRYVLKRTYVPLAISEKDDPLVQHKTYTLSSNNQYSIEDDIVFSCVPTVFRYHDIFLSALGGIANVMGANLSKIDTGVTCTLKEYGFDMEFESAK